MLLQSPVSFYLYRLESLNKAVITFAFDCQIMPGIFQQEREPPTAVRAAPELIREDQKEQREKKVQKKKKKLFANPHSFCALLAHPPTHKRSGGSLFFFPSQ